MEQNSPIGGLAKRDNIFVFKVSMTSSNKAHVHNHVKKLSLTLC